MSTDKTTSAAAPAVSDVPSENWDPALPAELCFNSNKFDYKVQLVNDRVTIHAESEDGSSYSLPKGLTGDLPAETIFKILSDHVTGQKRDKVAVNFPQKPNSEGQLVIGVTIGSHYPALNRSYQVSLDMECIDDVDRLKVNDSLSC
jgi:hypothetical protein